VPRVLAVLRAALTMIMRLGPHERLRRRSARRDRDQATISRTFTRSVMSLQDRELAGLSE
jgi:hypothetical protein